MDTPHQTSPGVALPDAYAAAQSRLEQAAAQFHQSLGGTLPPQPLGYHPNLIVAELRELRRMIEGASIEIEAECNEDGTITVDATLTWGA